MNDSTNTGQPRPLRRIAIVGASGCYGQALIRELRRERPSLRILGIDINEPSANAPDEFQKFDIRDPTIPDVLKAFAPDTIVHLAFVVDPIRDESRMHDINVNGTRNVLAAAEAIQPERFLLSSSATAYGAWPDNPVPLSEGDTLRGRPEYRYSHDKVLVEELLTEFADRNENITVSCTRPAIIYEEGVDNYLTKAIAKGPVIVMADRNDTPLQFVHADDVAAATRLILEKNASGPFNIGPNDSVLLSEMARMTNRRTISAPLRGCLWFTRLWWGCRLPLYRFPASLWYYIRYPWVVASDRLINELGFDFRYTSRETISLMFECIRGSKPLPAPDSNDKADHQAMVGSGRGSVEQH